MSQRDGAVFLLGAGFARAISPSMPLLQDLADRVTGALTETASIPPEVDAMMSENFAHALSHSEIRVYSRPFAVSHCIDAAEDSGSGFYFDNAFQGTRRTSSHGPQHP